MRIAHLADIQVRAHSRHEEFEKSFEHLYRSLQFYKPDRIVLAGDIVHNKTNISPEQMYVVGCLLYQLAQIAPLDVILGNHDLAMRNLTRMDALTPIIEALRSTRIQFFRDSGVYHIDGNFQYVVMSCVDQEGKWKHFRDLAKKSKVNICLWHGTINGVTLDNGSTLDSPYGLDLFKGLDYALLGDIHKQQFLDKERRVAYPGSYPKQNWGEDLHGGYLLWDIESKDRHKVELIQLPTVCPYYTLQIPESLEVPRHPLWEKYARVRTVSRPLNAAERKQVADAVTEMYEPCELKITFDKDQEKSEVVIADGVRVENLRQEVVQQKLLKDYFDDLGDEDLQKMYEINETCSVDESEVLRNVRYKILDYSFDGLFSYGSVNRMPLEDLKGIVGVFGPNAAGKSTAAVDAPLYALFNRTSKDVSKVQQIINERKDAVDAAIRLQLNGEEYKIVRQTKLKHTKKRNGTVETSSESTVSFKCVGSGKDLADIDRVQTDKNIRLFFGTPEDFLQTSVAAQFDLLGFVSNKAAERKKTIARYFDLQLFEEKHKLANEKLKEMKYQLKSLDMSNFEERKNAASSKIQDLNCKIEAAQREADSKRRLYEFGQKKMEELKVEEACHHARRQRDGAAIKTEYLSSKREFDSLTEEMQEFDQYECISNPNCCMAQRRESVLARLKKSETRREAIKERLLEFSEEMKKSAADLEPHMAELRKTSDACKELAAHEAAARNEVLSYTRQVAAEDAVLRRMWLDREKFNRINAEYGLQERYVKAMSKDGLPYQIVTQNLSRINQEIAAILGTDLPFDVWLDDDGKEINVYFQNPDEKPRLIELCSGMEKTVAAILVRAALISVTSLPVSNVFVLDESFTSLDADHMQAVGRVLSGLKRIFDTIILICHSEQSKDLCDHIVTVEKDGQGYSKLS